MQRGFTLLELSIVLVIIGLIAGGVLVGRDMVRQAELRSTMTSVNNIIASVHTFEDKYMAFPGDMRNAVSYWGAQAGSTSDGIDATCIALTTPATSTATCNGNGNGIIGENASTVEHFRIWQHLANAGMIEGQYSGVHGSLATWSAVAGWNIPEAKISGTGFNLWTEDGNPAAFHGKIERNIISYSGFTPSSHNFPVLTPKEAFQIDTKEDDGKPFMGNIITYSQTVGLPWSSCTTSDDLNTAGYDMANDIPACAMVRRNIF